MKARLSLSENIFSIAFWMLLGWMLTSTVYAATPDEATSMVQDTTNRMLSALEQRRAAIEANAEVVYEIANEIAVPHFDFAGITKSALGKNWRKADATQLAALTAEFQTLLVHTYGGALRNYSGQKIELLPVRPGTDPNKIEVKTRVIMSGGGSPIPINYLLHIRDGAWKVYDVRIDGVSLVKNYRSSFDQEIRNGGIQGLILSLQKRNQAAPK